MAIVMENIKRLLDQRANAWETTGKPLADVAAERAFTAEEQGSWEKAEADFRGYTDRIHALEAQLEQERAIEQFADALKNDNDVRRAFEDELRSVLVLRESTSTQFEFSGKEMKRALAKGAPATGGNVVPTDFLTELIQPLRNFASVLNAGARVIVTAGGADLIVPSLTSAGAAASATEAGALAGTDPTFGQKALKAYKYAQLIKTSRELIEDSAIDVESLVAELIGENIGLALGAKLAVGAGTTETAGIITAATVGLQGATAGGGFSFDDIIDVHYSVTAPYRVNGSWLFADSALGAARKLKSTGDGQYLWSPSVQVGQPDLILGKPVYTDANMDSIGINKKPFGFGDVSRYWVRFVNSLRVERSDQFAFNTDEIAFRGVLRADGILTDASAFKTFQGKAS